MDLSKFRKSLTKSISGLSFGFHDPKIWLCTGNYTLNYLISSDFHKGVPLGKVTMFAGESGCLPKSGTINARFAENHNDVLSTVVSLNTAFHTGKSIEINTPDGWCTISNWFDKGMMDIVVVTTESGLATRCATNHLLQLSDGNWIPANEVDVGMALLTINSPNDQVTVVRLDGSEECYDFTVDHENHRYWGDGFSSHNSGKSYICSSNIVKDAQAKGIFVVLIDSENALDEAWLHALGVDTSDDKLMKINMAMIDDVAFTISEFMKEYKLESEETRRKVLFVVDSLGMLLTPTDAKQFEAGDLKGDMGRKAKSLTALIRNCVNMFGNVDAGLVCTNHTYASTDMFDPDQKISGGAMAIFASSIVVAMNKRKLKEDSDGNKVTEVNGIRSLCKVMKSRYAKPFESVEVKIPYDTGMNPYSGLFEMFEKKQLLVKSGNSYIYTKVDGTTIKQFRKAWEANTNGCLDLLMKEFMERDDVPIVGVGVDDDDDDGDDLYEEIAVEVDE